MELIEAANKVLAWWEDARYKTEGEYGDYNVFDEDDDYIFNVLKEAVKETTDEG